METEKTFRTKTGFCHITNDKIVLIRDGVIGNVAKAAVGNNISRILTIYGLLSLGLFYFSYDSYLKRDLAISFLFFLFGVYLIYGIIRSLNNSATPVIERKDVRRTVFKKGNPGFTRSRFEIDFEENGRVKKRLILLPGSLTSEQDETENALRIMREERLLS